VFGCVRTVGSARGASVALNGSPVARSSRVTTPPGGSLAVVLAVSAPNGPACCSDEGARERWTGSTRATCVAMWRRRWRLRRRVR